MRANSGVIAEVIDAGIDSDDKDDDGSRGLKSSGHAGTMAH